MRQDRWPLAFIFVISLLLFYHFRSPFFGPWDSFDYMWQIIRHRPSDLAFGRIYYIGYNILIWESARGLFGLAVDDAHKVIQSATLFIGGLTLLVHFVFVRRLVNRDVALLSTILLMGSPLFIVFSGCIMTEIPMLFFLISGLSVYLRGLDENKKHFLALGSGLVGFSIHVREQGLFFLPLLMMLPFIRQRNAAGKGIKVLALTFFPAAIVAALGPMGLLISDGQNYISRIRYWSSKVPPNYNIDLYTLKTALFYTLINSPMAVVLSVLGFMRLLFQKSKDEFAAARRELLAFFFFAILLPLFLLLPDPDLRMHPRYELSLIPGITILAVIYIRQMFSSSGLSAAWKYLFVVFASALIIVEASPYINDYRVAQREMRELTGHLLKTTPYNAAFIPGTYTPVIEYYRQTGIRPDWQIVRSGWEWSRPRLLALVNKFVEEGREIYIIHDRNAWRSLGHELEDVNRLRDKFEIVPIEDRLQKLQPKG